MKRPGMDHVMAQTLLTDPVLNHLLDAGFPTVEDETLAWRSWPQSFPTTAGPWLRMGGRAVTSVQITVAHDFARQRVLIFAGADLLSYGHTSNEWFWDQVRGSSINTATLTSHGLTVLDRPLAPVAASA